MPPTWKLKNVDNKIWVDASAGTGGNGSEENPYDTIMDAVSVATPGTVILVKAGTYYEEVEMLAGTTDGEDDAPILLVSADGIEAAVIQPPSELSGITSDKNSNWGIIGFHIITDVQDDSHDESPIKIGGKFNRTGPEDKKNYNWFIAGNRSSGYGNDGIKVNSGRGFFIIGNTIDGSFPDEQLDGYMAGAVSTSAKSQVGFNTFIGYASDDNAGGVVFKGGANHFQIFNNLFDYDHYDGNSVAVKLGSIYNEGNPYPDINTYSEFWPSNPPMGDYPDDLPRTANNFEIVFNKFTGDFGKCVAFSGAEYCTASYNDMANTDLKGNEVADNIFDNKETTNIDIAPHHVTVTYNKVVGTDLQYGGSSNDKLDVETAPYMTYEVHDNDNTQAFTWTVGADAVAPFIEDLIIYLREGVSEEMRMNLVLNDGFEDGDDGNWSSESGISFQSSETFDFSQYALKINPGGTLRKSIQTIEVTPGEKLDASCFMKAVGLDGIKRGHYQLRFYDNDSEGTYNSSEANPYRICIVTAVSEYSTPNDDWAYYSMKDIEVPDDADFVLVWLGCSSSTGQVYFDKISLNASTLIPGTELLTDGFFKDENESGLWSIHSTAEIDSDEGIYGTEGLVQTGESGWTITQQTVDVTGMTSLNAAAFMWAENIDIEKNAIYQVRFYDASDVKIQTELVGSVNGSNGGYEQFIRLDIPVPATAVTAKVYIGVTGGDQGVAKFDGIQLTEAP